MKTLVSNFRAIFSLALIIFLVVSCKNYNKPAIEESTVIIEHSNIDHLRMFFEKLHPNDQRAIFNMLPSEMKYALVNNHWNRQLQMTNNQNEKAFIQDLIDHLKPIYYKDTAVYQNQGAAFFGNQADAGLAAFQNDSAKVVSILFQIGGDAHANTIIAAVGDPSCECNIKKGWCSFFGNCGTFDCTTSVAGCGPGFLESCNGMCIMMSEIEPSIEEEGEF